MNEIIGILIFCIITSLAIIALGSIVYLFGEVLDWLLRKVERILKGLGEIKETQSFQCACGEIHSAEVNIFETYYYQCEYCTSKNYIK